MKVFFRNERGELFFWRQKAWIFMKDGVKDCFDIGYFRMSKKSNAKYGNYMHETQHQSRPYKCKVDCLKDYLKYNSSLTNPNG